MYKIMTKKVFHSVHATLLLTAAMFFAACAEDVVVEKANQKTDADYEGLTCFAAEAPEATRTSMYRNGRFAWVNRGDTVDHVWVVKGGTPLLSDEMVITSDSSTLAKFYLDGDYDATEYAVLYAGSVVGTKPSAVPDVVIAEKQVQREPNNSEHFGVSGDCGTATAKKNGSRYTFTLGHEMAYLMFEPRMDETGDVMATVIKKITIKEINGKNIRGTFKLSGTGATLVEGSGGDEITVICGEDVEAVDAGSKNPSEAKNYGFYINNIDYTPYGKTKVTDGEDVEETANGRIFMVIKPTVDGEPYELSVKYDYATGASQSADHLSEWGMGYDYDWTDVTKSVTFTPKKGEFYRIRHKLKVTSTAVVDKYPFKQYYMWGASKWFWYAAEVAKTPYPVHNDAYETEHAPSPGSDSWYKDGVSGFGTGDICVGTFNSSGSNLYVDRSAAPANRLKAKLRQGRRRNQASGGVWADALTANQMSFYVMFGDPYYDSEKEWILEEYNGVETVCKGGVWLRKKEKIREYLNNVYNVGKADYQKLYWPDGNDGATTNYSAPFNAAKYLETVPAISNSEKTKVNALKDQQFNLRYMLPEFNYRMPYTNWDAAANDWMEGVHRPSQDTRFHKNDDDYFFVPCLGRFEYDNNQTAENDVDVIFPTLTGDYNEIGSKTVHFDVVEGTGAPTLTLVGAQGFYWTKTPVQFHWGSGTRFYKYYYADGGSSKSDTPPLLSEYSNFDNYAYNQAEYDRWYELFTKESEFTDEERKEYSRLYSRLIKDVSADPETGRFAERTPNTILRGIYRYNRYGHYNDNAIYLNLHYHYIALSWQQHSIYVKTGMRVATNGYDEGKTGMFK